MARPKAGYVNKHGKKVPGTTTITGRFGEKGGLLHWAFSQGASGAASLYEKRDEAADVGTHVHAMWEAILRSMPVPPYPTGFSDDMQVQANRALAAAVRWQDDSGLKVRAWEEPIVSELFQFGGTPDALITGKRGGSLADWKTGKGIYIDTWLQMAAYLQLLEENQIADTSDGCHIVRFGKNGEFQHTHIPRSHPALALCLAQFVDFIRCYDRDKWLKSLIG